MASVSQIRRMMQMSTPHQETVTDDAVASFATDFPAPAMVKAEFSPVQAGSGDPSPDNVRPISGWTECIIGNGGKNLCKTSLGKPIGSLSVFEYDANDNSYDIQTNGQYQGITFEVNVVSGTTYTFSCKFVGTENATTKTMALTTTTEGTVRQATPETSTSGEGYLQLTYTAVETEALNFRIYLRRGSPNNFYGTLSEVMMEEGASRTTDKTVILPLNWQSSAGTVYGGYFQLNEDGTGTLTVDREGFVFADGTGWAQSSGGMPYYTLSSAAVPADSICSHFKTTPAVYSEAALYTGNYNGNPAIIVGNGLGYSYKLSAFTDYLTAQSQNGTPVTYVIKLVTPITYPLSASQIKTLLGTNNVWTDLNGDVTVRFFKHG